MIPLNLSEDQAQNLASTFRCKLGGLPFTYLGLPLGTTKPKIIDLMPFGGEIYCIFVTSLEE